MNGAAALPEGLLPLLEGLLNSDTTRSARNETPAANILARFFRECGIPYALYEPFGGRVSVVARIRGRTQKSVLLLSHLDTEDERGPGGYTAAKASFSSDAVAGRGALDCKGNAAVLACVLRDLAREGAALENTVVFAATAGEEDGGAAGTGWLMENTDAFSGAALVLGEGGGYPLPYGEEWYFTLQTGEITASDLPAQPPSGGAYTEALLGRAVRQGFYNEATRSYIAALPGNPHRRRMPPEHFVNGLPEFLESPENRAMRWTPGRLSHLAVFEKALAQCDPAYRAMPVVTPGYSDNRYFRARGVETWGFFPLHPANRIAGIHGAGEYISYRSLRLAYACLLAVAGEFAKERGTD